MVRRTISVGRKTWEALSALGKFGQSFDDVIQILLQEHDELKKLKQQLTSQQPQTQRQQPSSDTDEIREAITAYIEATKEFNPELYKRLEQKLEQEAQPFIDMDPSKHIFEQDTGGEQPAEEQQPQQRTYYQRQQDDPQLQKKFSALEKFIRKIAEELGITKLEATIRIRSRKDLLKRAADEMGTDDEAHVLGIITRQIELFENEPFEKDQQQEQHVPTAAKREYSEKIIRPGESYEEEEVTAERERKEKKQLSKELGED